MAGTEVTLYQTKSLVALERMVRRRLWSRLRNAAASLPFAQEVLAAYFCAVDRRTPLAVKTTLIASLAGFLLPQRVIPRALRSLVVGGDVGILLGAFGNFAAHITPEHRMRARLVLIRLRQASEK